MNNGRKDNEMEVSNDYSLKSEGERDSNENLLHDSLIALLVSEIGVDGKQRRELTLGQKLKVFIKSCAVHLTVDREKRDFLLFLWFIAIASVFSFVVSCKIGNDSTNIMTSIVMIPLVFIVFLFHLTYFCLFCDRVNGLNGEDGGDVVNRVYTGNPLMKALGIDWSASLSSQKNNIREAFYYMSLVLDRLGYKYNYESLLRNMESESNGFFERKMILDLFNNYVNIILMSLQEGSPNYSLVKRDWDLLGRREGEYNNGLSQERVVRFMELLRANVRS